MTSVDLLARLRGHVWDCTREPWPGRCRPETGRYCSIGRLMYGGFYAVRRAEVLAAQVERLEAGAVASA